MTLVLVAPVVVDTQVLLDTPLLLDTHVLLDTRSVSHDVLTVVIGKCKQVLTGRF